MKPGWQTTEFWLTVVNTVFMVLVAFGILQQDQASELNALIAPLIGALVPLIVYIVGRVVVKSRALNKG